MHATSKRHHDLKNIYNFYKKRVHERLFFLSLSLISSLDGEEDQAATTETNWSRLTTRTRWAWFWWWFCSFFFFSAEEADDDQEKHDVMMIFPPDTLLLFSLALLPLEVYELPLQLRFFLSSVVNFFFLEWFCRCCFRKKNSPSVMHVCSLMTFIMGLFRAYYVFVNVLMWATTSQQSMGVCMLF